MLLVLTSCSVFFMSYLILYMCVSMPGNRLGSGLMFGIAESSSSLLSGIVCTFIKDSFAFMGSMAITGISQIVFF